MGIEVAWIDEQQKVIELLVDAKNVTSQLASSRWPRLSATVCLRFVEPWGDTVFNQSQIPILLDELRAELAVAIQPRESEHLSLMIRLVEKAVDQVHTYIKFIGD